MFKATLDPNIRSSCDGEDEKEQDEHECLQVIGCHSLHTKQNRPQQLTL